MNNVMSGTAYVMQQKIKKRENEIVFNNTIIRRLKDDANMTKDVLLKKQLEIRIRGIANQNAILKRKNRNFQW